MEYGEKYGYFRVSKDEKEKMVEALVEDHRSEELIEALRQFNGHKEVPPDAMRDIVKSVVCLANQGDQAAQQIVSDYEEMTN